MAKRKVVLIACGGTIVSVPGADGFASPRLTPAELLASSPAMTKTADISVDAFGSVTSPDLTMSDVVSIARRVDDAARRGVDGVVVSMGTDTLEEVAFGVDLLHRGDAPVIFTGAMRPAGSPGSDGPANLLCAVQVAASPDARALGVVVVMNDEIHAARHIRKGHATNPGAFRSYGLGPIGWIREGVPTIAARPIRGPRVSFPEDAELPDVCLLTASLGDRGRQLGLIQDAGFAGVVIEGFGGGHLPSAMADSPAFAELLRRVPVVLSSRTGAGELLERTYGGASGTESALHARGVISAGALDGPKARVLLTLLLGAGVPAQEIAARFAGQ